MQAVGFVPVLVFAWLFELTPDGLKRDAEVTPEESIAIGFDKFVLAPKRLRIAPGVDGIRADAAFKALLVTR